MERCILMKRMTQLITNRPPPPPHYVSYILLLLHVLKQTGNETTENICHHRRRTRARCIHDESAEGDADEDESTCCRLTPSSALSGRV